MKHHIIAFGLILSVALPGIVMAQAGTVPVGGSDTTVPVGGGESMQDIKASTKLENPLRDVDNLGDFFYLVINFIYSLSYAVIALFLIISGFKFVMAQGKPDALDNAKTTFKYTIIGAILLISANVLTEVVRSVINQFVDTSI